MRFCRMCVLPDTRPGVKLVDGLCNACRHALYKKTVDWVKRRKEFEKLCDQYRRRAHGEHDCIVAASAGKDSWWQVKTLKLDFNMNPLLVNVDNLDWTDTGEENFQNLLDVFGVDAIIYRINRELYRRMSRISFEYDGFTAWLFDRLIYTYPLHMAIKFNIPLVFYGENVSVEYGGYQTEDTPSAFDQINNDVVRDYGWDLWLRNGVSMDELVMAKYPTQEEIRESKLNPRYMSYYFNWSGYEHMLVAKQYGWKSLGDTGEWQREGFIEDYDQIDDYMYLVDPWLKYPKYGHARATDVACYWIREGRITREEAVKLVKEHDHKIDPIALEHYLRFTGYTEDQFWSIVEKFWNKDLFKYDPSSPYDKHKYVLKNPIWEA